MIWNDFLESDIVKNDVVFVKNCHVVIFPDLRQNEKDAQRDCNQSCTIFAMRSLFWTCLVNKVLFSTSMIFVQVLPYLVIVDHVLSCCVHYDPI